MINIGRKIIKLFSLIACFVFFFWIDVDAKEKKMYVALGDSITYGYTLDDPEKECYPALFASEKDLLLNNESYVGDDSYDLIEKLPGFEGKLAEADVISLCIGANDLLGFAVELFGEDIGDPEALFGKIMDLREGVYDEQIDEILQNFKTNFDLIINKLLESKAQLYVLTVYNPYKDIELYKINEIVNEWIKKLNQIISSRKDEYHLVDVYKAFERNDQQLVNANVDDFDIDPHPNIKGQKVIYNTLVDSYEKQNQKDKKPWALVFGISAGAAMLMVAGFFIIKNKMKSKD